MDSPLNMAHQQGRKADALVKSGKFEDAIVCHHRAAEFLLEAMRHTTCQTALQSIQLQHAHHLKKTSQLTDKQRRVDMLQIRQNKTSHKNQASQTDLQGQVVAAGFFGDQSENSPFQIQSCNQALRPESDTTGDTDDDSVYRTLTENDSLIGLLIRRRQNLDDLSSYHSGVPVERVFYNNPTANQSPTETDLREELRCHNEELRKHVCQLLREVDEHKKDKKILREKLDHYESKENTETIFHDMGESGLDLLPDLPPLEMPTFDIDLLLDEKSNDGASPSKSTG